MDPEFATTRNCYQGWSADKQRMFLRHLAATGSVTRAAEAVGMTARSAYYLRNRPDAKAFRDAWMEALRAAGDTLVGIAFDRAINGALQKYWQDGKLVGERLVPSDRMLTWLLARIGPDLPFRPLGKQETTWADLEHRMTLLPELRPTGEDNAERHRLQAQAELDAETPLQQLAPTALPAPEPHRIPARPRTRTHESPRKP